MRRDEFYPSYYFKDAQGQNTAQLVRSAGEPLRNLYVEGNSIQDTGHTKNIIPYPLTIKRDVEDHGITLTFNEDCSITINGTATSNFSYQLTPALTLDMSERHTLSVTNNMDIDTEVYLYYRMITAGKEVKWFSCAKTSSLGYLYTSINIPAYADSTNTGIYLYFREGATFDNRTITIQFEHGTSPTEHEPLANYVYPGTTCEVRSVGGENNGV